MAKRHLYQQRHPFDAYPFEAFFDGSWWKVELVRIKDGFITTIFEHHGYKIEEKVPISNLRIRSRIANSSDCTCFLRPGIDICVFTTNPNDASSDEIWIDAKINSIERKPHESRCTCRFYVSFDGVHRNIGIGKYTVNGEIREVTIRNIAILQQLDRTPCEDGYYRWSSSKDCPSKNVAKLFRGQFSYDVSWLLVASALKGVEFEIRSMQSKVVYQILDGDQDICSLDSDKIVKAINFQRDSEVLRPNIRTFVPEVPVDTINGGPLNDLQENGLCNLSPYDLMYLRRSKRRNVKPDFYVSYFGSSNVKSGAIRTETDRMKRRKGETSYSASFQADDDCLINAHCLEPQIGDERMVHDSKGDSDWRFLLTQSNIKSNEVKLGVNDIRTHLNRLAKNHKKDNTKTVCKRPGDDILCRQVQQSSYLSNQIQKEIEYSARNGATLPLKTFSGIPLFTTNDHVTCKQGHSHEMILAKQVEAIVKISSKYNVRSYPAAMKGTNKFRGRYRDVENRVKEIGSGKKRRSSGSSFSSKRKMSCDARTYRKCFASASEYKELIERYIQNIESKIEKHQQLNAGVQLEATHPLSRTLPITVQVENPELEDLWKEMEVSMTALHFIEESQSNAVGFPTDLGDKSREIEGQSCQHEYKLDEEIGIVCQLCSFVSTEIRYISPPFLQSMGRFRNQEECNETKSGCRYDGALDLDILSNPSSTRGISLQEENDNVWALIPEFRNNLHIHQKKAFEFLWRNIAGSLMPAEMEATSERTSGCVISHSPGSGKTLLVISFLVSYLRLFPEKRPLILAPKTILYTWYKEFKKWEVSIPVYQIHACKTYKKEILGQRVEESSWDRKLNQNMMHAIDCLEKVQKWHDHASVLVMSYPSFLSLMRKDSKSEPWRCMARVLHQSPGILILDEGHNPRSTRSMLRKALMKVKTEVRILLSGTLFQNNFEEYFNTLCLARPCFITEVLRELVPIVKRNRNGKKSTTIYKEKLARRFFVEKIANRINSKVEQERQHGLNMLKKITSSFIDVYESGASDRLPGLQSYRLLIKPTVTQQKILAKLQKDVPDKRFPLELELLVTVVSIHPWLITTLAYAGKYFSLNELEELKKRKLDVKEGSKVRFVVNLVYRCTIKREKVLIFCRNIAPMKLFVEIFESIFGWKMGEEVLVLYGEQELFERARVIEKYEEPGGVSQVLLASIAASGEGISLTAASRVILLDSEWNPSKTKQAVARAFRPGQERVVYVYQLLASGTMEEDKYGKNTWKAMVSRMLFVGAGMEDSSCRQAEKIDDDVLRDIIEEDQAESFHMIMKDEKLSYGLVGGKESVLFSLK